MERKTHMWWDEFEKKLTSEFVTHNIRNKRNVHSNEMKIRTLMHKVQADLLSQTNASIGLEI